MKTLVTIGNFHLPFFGTMIAIGMIAALVYLRHEAKRSQINVETITDLALWGIVGGVLGGRLGYILFYDLTTYLENPLEVFKIYKGGLSIHGGIIGGTTAVLIFIKMIKKELKVYDIADKVAPAIMLGQAIGRVGCDVYGKAMNAPRWWGIPIGGISYHPAQMYEFILDYLLFLVLWHQKSKIRYKGQLFGIYLIGFAIIRSGVEIFRNNPKLGGLLSVSHVLNLILMIIGVVWLKIAKTKKIEKEQVSNSSQLATKLLIVGMMMVLSIGVYYYVQLNL